MCNILSVSYLRSLLQRLGIPVTFAYASYGTATSIPLTIALQKVVGWNEQITPKNISYLDGVFTAEKAGVFAWTLERQYTNTDNNPNDRVVLTIEIRKNGQVFTTRSADIGTPSNPNKPIFSEFTSPFIVRVEKGDTFSFWVGGSDGLLDPTAAFFIIGQLTAHRIDS